MPVVPFLSTIASLSGTADVWFVDIWGVIHNGVKPYAAAVAACVNFRASGGTVVLVSNSPRPRDGVLAQLTAIGVEPATYDDVITSGDVSRRLIAALPSREIRHIGPERDRVLFDGLDVTRVSAEAADAVVCTGLFDDEVETAEDYGGELAALQARDLVMICANPDLTVERDGRIIYCAGAIAAAYAELGGRVLTAGKPHRPIYESAMDIVARLRGKSVARSRVLAIGDGALTDIAGAASFGIRSVFVASGVNVRRGETVVDAALRLFPDASTAPVAVMTALA